MTAKTSKPGVTELLKAFAQKNGQAFIAKMEMERVKETLSIYWPHIRQGFLGGYMSGVQAGFQFGFDSAQRFDKKLASMAKPETEKDDKQLELPLETKK